MRVLTVDHSLLVLLLGIGSAVGLVGAGGLMVRAARRADRAELGAVVALTAGAFALRWFAPWGPHDLNLRQAGSWIDIPRVDVGYGLGWTGIAVPLRTVWPGTWALRTLPDLGVVLSTLHVPLLVVWARGLGASVGVAWLAGALVALHPALVRFGHTDVQTLPETLWTLVALGAVEAWRRGVGGAVGLAGLAAGLAVHARPESLVVPLVVVAFAALRLPRPVRWRAVAGAVALAVVVAAPQVALQVGRLVVQEREAAGLPSLQELAQHPVWRHGWRHLIALDPAWISPLVAVGVFAAPWARSGSLATRGLVVVVGGLLALLVAGNTSWTPADGTRFGFARHQLRALPFLLLAQAWGWEAIGRRLGAGGWVYPAVAATMAWSLPLAWSPRAGPSEFRWLADWRSQVASGCTVYAPAYAQDAGLRLAHELLSPHGIAVRTEPVPPEDGACWLYYRSGECSMSKPPELRACEAFEAAHRLQAVAERWVVGAPWIYDDHKVDAVRIGLYRIVGPEEAR